MKHTDPTAPSPAGVTCSGLTSEDRACEYGQRELSEYLVARVLHAAGDELGIDLQTLIRGREDVPILARHACIWVLTELGFTHSQLERYLGIDHTTVWNARRSFCRKLALDDPRAKQVLRRITCQRNTQPNAPNSTKPPWTISSPAYTG